MDSSIGTLHAAILGIVEGLTEFLPISSTGHLMLAGHLLGVQGEAAKTFEIVIQAGVLVAVLGLYGARVRSMARGLPEDVAEAVSFFVSQRSSKTTGCILTVDGGLREAFPR